MAVVVVSSGDVGGGKGRVVDSDVGDWCYVDV